jgi:hypothetical protein
MSDSTYPEETYVGRVLDADLHLFDRQVLDVDGEPAFAVDDIEISDVPVGVPLDPDAPPPVIESLLSGPVLATRTFGGRPPSSRLERIPWRHVSDVGTALTLGVHSDELDATWTERWVRDKIIGRIPGGRHDPE